MDRRLAVYGAVLYSAYVQLSNLIKPADNREYYHDILKTMSNMNITVIERQVYAFSRRLTLSENPVASIPVVDSRLPAMLAQELDWRWGTCPLIKGAEACIGPAYTFPKTLSLETNHYWWIVEWIITCVVELCFTFMTSFLKPRVRIPLRAATDPVQDSLSDIPVSSDLLSVRCPAPDYDELDDRNTRNRKFALWLLGSARPNTQFRLNPAWIPPKLDVNATPELLIKSELQGRGVNANWTRRRLPVPGSIGFESRKALLLSRQELGVEQPREL